MTRQILTLGKQCTACSACLSACPKQLIKMVSDDVGFLYPAISDETKCTNCGRCDNICPILQTELRSKPTLKTYAASHKNHAELLSSSSGGVAAALTQKILSENGAIFGVTYNDEFTRAVFTKITRADNPESLKGSKYIQADKNIIFKEIANELRTGKKVLFTGLPCEVAGLYAYLGKKTYENLLTVDLICYGPTSPQVAEEYIQYLKSKYQSKIIEFSVRYKNEGKWTPPYLRAVFENGKTHLKPFYETEYGRAFSLMPRQSCYSCRFKGDHHISDLTIGDFWGCNNTDKFWNPHGVSIIFVHTAKGLDYLESLDELTLTETSYDKAVAGNQYLGYRLNDSQKKSFYQNFRDNGLFSACKSSITLKETAIKYGRKYLPTSVKQKLLWLYRKLR